MLLEHHHEGTVMNGLYTYSLAALIAIGAFFSNLTPAEAKTRTCRYSVMVTGEMGNGQKAYRLQVDTDIVGTGRGRAVRKRKARKEACENAMLNTKEQINRRWNDIEAKGCTQLAAFNQRNANEPPLTWIRFTTIIYSRVYEDEERSVDWETINRSTHYCSK